MSSSRPIEQIQEDLKQTFERIDVLQRELQQAYLCKCTENSQVGFSSASPSLSQEDVERFSRQIMLEGIGALGMEKIRKGTVLCVGAGGLGSTIALYLCAAGVGKLILVDFDHVDTSNLHRQIIHKTACVSWEKVRSAKLSCLSINPAALIETVSTALNPANAEEIMSQCDIAVDGSDNVAARYIINDAAIKCGKPLVSGSAMRWEGQLSVFGYQNGPCYRCLFPVPPPAEAVGSCNDTGVMGPVPGLIGCMQALEALKILAECGEVLSGRMFLFDGLRFTARTIKLRNRSKDCVSCGTECTASTPLADLIKDRPEYIPTSCVTGQACSARFLTDSQRCSPLEFSLAINESNKNICCNKEVSCICVDVRVKSQFDMAHLPYAKSLPLTDIRRWKRNDTVGSEWKRFLKGTLPSSQSEKMDRLETESSGGLSHPYLKVFFICRRGIASTEAVRILSESLDAVSPQISLINVEGGLNSFHNTVDRHFPLY